ncbi:hypothetical protein [Sulfurisphaera ohwakuensis]|uniref:Uncharacterized protein n=1 Tax=Sulfurisphaera ohwakuensis TaxID=69656 RepID=A0A650CGB3_SULOH|nr:hypothetical protein [Sulfurisphaera ohwakuensis]MBB5252633.1 hypothetical protein [Sulfurisphaera ohwakuensis]QGR16931.1 hypothetical protein D1869_06885 [Sulfurisphaera ohwakuensis]
MTETVPIPVSSSVLGELASIGIGAIIEYPIIRDTATCTATGIKNLLSNLTQQYELYPALAITDRVISRTTSVFQVVRHGIIIRTVEGNYYYIGGKSNYWAGGRSFHAYQGSTEFLLSPQGEENSPIWQMIRQAQSNIIVLQVKGIRISQQWVNPKPTVNCQEIIVGWILDTLENVARSSVVMNYLPYFTQQPVFNIKVPGIWIDESGGKLAASALLGILRNFSRRPPFPYYAILTHKSIPPGSIPSGLYTNLKGFAELIFMLFPAYIQTPLCNFITGNVGECVYLNYDSSIQGNPYFSNPTYYDAYYRYYKEMLIGAPVFSSYSCASGCKGLGLSGLIYSILDNIGIQQYTFTSMIVIPTPKTVNGEYTDDSIMEYANMLGVGDILSLSKKYVSSASKAEATLISALGLSAAVASAIIAIVTWYEDWERTYDEAKKYADTAKNVIDRVRNYLNSTHQYDLLSYVDECVADSISELGNEALNEDELYNYTISCVEEHRENQAY